MERTKPFVVSEQNFRLLLQGRMDENSWQRAHAVFKNYGPGFSLKVASALDLAVRQGKTETILGTLEEHYETHLHLKAQEVSWGAEGARVRINPTETMFQKLNNINLNLKPSTA